MQIASKTIQLSDRVQKRLKLVKESRFHEKPIWGEGLTVLNEETSKLPLVKRKALAICKVLSEIPVQIGEGELLVGSATQSSLATSMPFPDYATQEEIEAAAKNFTGTRSIFGHFTPYYPRYLKLGLSGLQRIAEEKLNETRQEGTDPEKEVWYESVIMSLNGLKNLIQRYGDLASKLADSETDLTRKGELQEIARISQHLLEGNPQTFREALQAFWFAHMAFHSTLNMLAVGRFDQNLWPYLKQDLENDTISINEAQELVDLLWLKFNERSQSLEVVGDTSYIPDRYTQIGNATWVGMWGYFLGGKTSFDRFRVQSENYSQLLQTMTLSGLTPAGLDGTNPLTYLCLNAVLRLRLPWPSVHVRFHDGSPPKLYERVADCIRAGCIGPTIYNDEVVVPAFEKLGIPVEHARDYTSDGCWEPHPQGRTYFKFSKVPAGELLDRVLSPETWEKVEAPVFYMESLDPFKSSKAADPYAFRSFSEVMESFKKQLDKYVQKLIEVIEWFWDSRLYNIAPLPLLSAFVENPLEQGKDVTQGGMNYTFHAPLLGGLSHVADSLAVIKKLCFEEKAIAWSELLDAIRNNWRDKEPLRQFVRTRVPAYGNDADYVDDIAKEIVEYFTNSVRRYSAKVKKNIKYPPGIATFSSYIDMGSLIGATPDGRLAGEPLSSNASPSVGRAVSGQTAAVNSFLKLNQVDLPGGAALDLTMPSRAGLLLQLESFIKSFLEKRGNLINIAVNDCEKLRAAQKEPEKYRDLTIRIGGWQVYFVDLPREHQDWQIQKCEQYA